jgi:hypothetical protein
MAPARGLPPGQAEDGSGPVVLSGRLCVERVWEPNARAHPGDAADWTRSAAVGVLGAAAECPSLEHVVVRSGISVYGRRRARRPAPTSPSA